MVFISFSVLNAGIIVSQTSEIDLHKKYWYYKSRFNNDFIKIVRSKMKVFHLIKEEAGTSKAQKKLL